MVELVGAEIAGVAVLRPAVQCYVTGAGPTLAPNTMQGDDPCWLWLAPDRTLFVAHAPHAAPGEGFVSDISDGLIAFEIADAVLIAMSCTLDPFGPLLAPGRCAQTMFGGIKALIYPSGAAWRVHAERQFAAYLLEWFAQASSALR